MTAANLGAATIQGPGDLPGVNLEGFLFFNGGDNQGWTISNLQIYDFDLGIGMFNGADGVDAFNNTTITNNSIRVPTDLNTTVAPADANQNIGIHFSFGVNQTIQGNTIEFNGDGVSDSGANRFASSVGMQSNTSGGSVYDGLLIDNNTLHVLNAQSADPETILGIWENAHGHASDITVSNNQFLNQAAGNNPAINLQRAFRVTSHSGPGTTVTYENNSIHGANIGFQWLAGSNFTGNQPVRLWENTVTNSDTGILVQSNGLANLYRNNISGSGSGGGIHVITGQLAASGPVTNAVQENFIRNGSTGLLIDATAGAIGPIFNNDLSGNSGFAVNNGSASAIIAEANWWGSDNPATVAGEIVGNVDATPFLRISTDTQPGVAGFQGDFADHLTFDQQPTDTLAGQVITPAVTIQVIDIFDNLLTTDASNVTLAIGTNPGGGVLSGTLTVATVNGIATFDNLSINSPGIGYTLVASHDVLTSAPSAAFEIKPLPQITVAASGLPSETGPASGNFTFNLVPAPEADLVINFTLAGTATNLADYTLSAGSNASSVGAGSFIVKAGSGTASVVLTPIDDSADEANEIARMTLSGGTGYTMGANNTATLTIIDNDEPAPNLFYFPLLFKNFGAAQAAPAESGPAPLLENKD